MRHLAGALLLAALVARPATAEPVRFRAGLDVGAAFGPREGGPRDEVGIVNLVPAAVFRVAPRWELAVGATIPAAPVLDLQVPVTVAYRRGRLLLRAVLRPAYAAIDRGDSAEAERAFGLLGELGPGLRFPFGDPYDGDRSWSVDVHAGYVGGAWFGRAGYWQGFAIGADVTF